MIHNEIILKFTDDFCVYTNKIFSNNFDDLKSTIKCYNNIEL